MEDYLLDRETLAQFIDALMKKRTLPVETAEELSSYKEAQMKALDDHITQAIFDSLDQPQASELGQLLSDESAGQDVFQNFFQNQNINVEQIISDAAESFSREFLAGGQNV